LFYSLIELHIAGKTNIIKHICDTITVSEDMEKHIMKEKATTSLVMTRKGQK